ncbi:MAG: flagellar basal body P-ring protein FlgI [Bacillota bacterium]
MKIRSYKCILSLFLALIVLLSVAPVWTSFAQDPIVKIGDITRIKGVRENQLTGYGIVTGLAGTGDSGSSQATLQSIANMLQNYGVQVKSDQISSGNVAAVMVTAKLPPFAHSGDEIDVTVSSVGDAESLQGGTLMTTPLRAGNQDVYAVAQGPLSIGGLNAQSGGTQVRENHPTVGRIPDGALIEKELGVELDSERLTYLLDEPNFETAQAIANKINEEFDNSGLARASDAGTIEIRVPDRHQNDMVDFVSRLNSLEVRSSVEAKVVIDEKTGTIVLSHNVRISTVAVAHGNLTVTIKSKEEVSQPEPLSEGETEVTEETDIQVEEEEGNIMVIQSENTIQDLVTALNTVGASPRDIVSIMQKIKSAGALHAKLELE